jgi:hypothetical protein
MKLRSRILLVLYLWPKGTNGRASANVTLRAATASTGEELFPSGPHGLVQPLPQVTNGRDSEMWEFHTSAGVAGRP